MISKFSVKFFSEAMAFCDRLFFRCVTAPVCYFVFLNADHPRKRVVGQKSDSLYAAKTTSVELGVLHILRASAFSKIFPAVIARKFIDVVNFVRKRSSHVEPCETVSAVASTPHLDVNIALWVKSAGDCALWGARPSPYSPSKFPGFGAVVKNFFKLALCYHSHSATLQRLCYYGNTAAGAIQYWRY